MKLLKKSKSIRTRVPQNISTSITVMERFNRTQMYAPIKFYTCSFPHGDLNISKEKLGFLLSFWPVEIHLDYDDEEFSEKKNDVLWLIDYKNKYPNYPSIYNALISYFEEKKDFESWKTMIVEFQKNCKETPYALFQELHFQKIIEQKTAEELIAEHGHIMGNLHAAYPSRKCFYIEEVFLFIEFYFVSAINSRNFDVAQQYIDKVLEALDPEDFDLVENWQSTLKLAKLPLWRRVIPGVLSWSLLLGVIVLVCWIIYKIGAWVASLI